MCFLCLQKMATLTRTFLNTYDIKERRGNKIYYHIQKQNHLKIVFRSTCGLMAFYAITLPHNDDPGGVFVFRFEVRPKINGKKETDGAETCLDRL